MSPENRSEFIGAKASPETKKYFEQLKKDTGKTPADILEIMAKTKISDIELEILYKTEGLKTQMEYNSKIIKRLEDTMNYVKGQNKSIMKEIQKLSTKKPKNPRLSDNSEDNIKQSVNSYLETRGRQTNVFGELNPTFDTEKAGRSVCSYNNADYSVFCLCIEAIDNHEFTLDEFNKKSLIELGITCGK